MEVEPAFCVEWNGIDGYEVRVQGFDDVESVQFSMRWDPTQAALLELVTVQDITDPSDFFLDNADEGELTMVWTDGGLSPLTLLDGEIFFSLRMDVSDVESGAPYITDDPLAYELTDADGNVYMELRAMANCLGSVRSGSLIRGTLLVDTDMDCESSAADRALPSTIITYMSATDTIHTRTDTDGNYLIELRPDDYQVDVQADDYLYTACQAYTLTVDDATAVDTLDILLEEQNICATVHIDMIHSAAITCDETIFQIHYDNRGTDVARGFFIDVSWDPSWSYVGSESAFVRITDELYRLLLPDVDPQSTGTVELRLFLDCDAEDGSSHRVVSQVLPVVYCEEISPDWSRASIEVEAECEGDSVRFAISNVGIVAMAEPLDGIILEDDLGGFVRDVLLPPGEQIIEKREANGSTWTLLIPQVSGHPGSSFPAVSIESCNDGVTMNSLGFRPDYAEDDEDVFIDRDLLIADRDELSLKSALPTGYGPENFISADRSIEYTLRYQNTTGLTLDRLSFVDEIPESLDIESLTDIQSSHPVQVILNSDNSITFSFTDLLLPDSSINSVESQIYVSYRLSPVEGIAPGTLIENYGELYLSYDRAAKTALVFHTVIDSLGPIITSLLDLPQSKELQIAPNPSASNNVIHLPNLVHDGNSSFTLISADGRVVVRSALLDNHIDLSPHDLPPAWYLLQVYTHEGHLYQAIIMLTE